jgi:hypothetical protein
MALSDLDVKQVYGGDGASTTFAVPFAFDSTDTSTVKVYLRDESVDPATETLQTEGGGNDYTISGTNVVMATAPAATEKLIVIRVTPLTQEFNPVTTARVDLEALEAEMDKIVEMVQELDDRLDRAPILSKGGGVSGVQLPDPEASAYLRWNAGATDLENAGLNDQTVANIIITGLTASRPVKTNGSKQLVSGAIDLTSSDEVSGALPIGNGGTGQTTKAAAFDALSPTTTKGDLTVNNGTNNIRVAGSSVDNYVLTYDSAEASGVKWAPASGGGGGGFTWFNDDGDAPVNQVKFNNKVWSFSDGGSQNLYTTVKVPQGYIPGSQIKMYVTHFHEASSATQLLSAQATLIEPGDVFDDTTDQRTTTNTAQTGATKVTIQAVLDLTDSSGQINSVAVAAGDLIKVRLYRGTDTSASDIYFIESSTEVTFS